MKRDVNQRHNLLCRAMEATIGSRGAIDAREVSLKQGAIVCEARDPVRQVYFPISCVLLALVPVRDGTMVAITLRGREGAYGHGSSKSFGTRTLRGANRWICSSN